jgi:hypothetical protein
MIVGDTADRAIIRSTETSSVGVTNRSKFDLTNEGKVIHTDVVQWVNASRGRGWVTRRIAVGLEDARLIDDEAGRRTIGQGPGDVGTQHHLPEFKQIRESRQCSDHCRNTGCPRSDATRRRCARTCPFRLKTRQVRESSICHGHNRYRVWNFATAIQLETTRIDPCRDGWLWVRSGQHDMGTTEC